MIRQEAEGLRRYCHVGTGNYNPKTARLYEDLGLLTADDQVGEDLTRLFNQLSGYRAAQQVQAAARRAAVPALGADRPDRRRDRARSRPAGPGRSHCKLNSIVDEQLIDALYRASQAGVHGRQPWVRGICALRPGVPGPVREHRGALRSSAASSSTRASSCSAPAATPRPSSAAPT